MTKFDVMNLPNLITSINLLLGCVSIVLLLNAQFELMFISISIALIADLLDGAVARLLNAASELGKQLDSLADMVSFGVLPGAVYYYLIKEYALTSGGQGEMLAFVGFIVTITSAIRLGRFNIEAQAAAYFNGLPTPANAIWSLGLLYSIEFNGFGHAFLVKPYVIFGALFLSSYLLNAPLRMFSLKFNPFKWKGHEIQILFLLISVLMFIFVQLDAFYWIIWLYVLSSLFYHYKKPL